MNNRSGCRYRLVDFQVKQDLTRVCACSQYPLIFQAYERQILECKVSFAAEGWGAKDIIRGDSIGYISAISVHIFPVPQFLADGNNLFLDRFSLRRFKKEFGSGSCIIGVRGVRKALQEHMADHSDDRVSTDLEGVVQNGVHYTARKIQNQPKCVTFIYTV